MRLAGKGQFGNKLFKILPLKPMFLPLLGSAFQVKGSKEAVGSVNLLLSGALTWESGVNGQGRLQAICRTAYPIRKESIRSPFAQLLYCNGSLERSDSPHMVGSEFNPITPNAIVKVL